MHRKNVMPEETKKKVRERHPQPSSEMSPEITAQGADNPLAKTVTGAETRFPEENLKIE